MTTLNCGNIDVPAYRKRPGSIAFAVATTALAVTGFVVISLFLKSIAHFALYSQGLSEDSYGQCAEYVLVTALSMFAVRKVMDLLAIRYEGRLVFSVFLTASVLVMMFGLSSMTMKVDLLISLLQMSMLCLFAYFQFWNRNASVDSDIPG